MMRCVLLLFAAILFIVAVRAETVCLSGSANLSMSVTAPNTTYCDADDCSVQFELSFDRTAAGSSRWPLSVLLADGTYLADRFPELADGVFHCDSAGNIVFSTALGANSEHMRLLWIYSGASSFDCSYVFQTVDWSADFSQFQVLLAYSGDASAFDAVYASSDAATSSMAALMVTCPEEPIATTTSTGAPTTGATTGAAPDVAPAEFGDCRYPLSMWITTRRHAAEWLTLAELSLCTVSYEDIAYARGDALNLPTGVLALSQAVVEATLNGRMYGLDDSAIDEQLPEFEAAYAIVANPINCASTDSYSDLVLSLHTFSNATSACAGVPADAETHNETCTDKKQRAYLIWAIVMTCLFGAMVIFVGVIMILFFWRVGTSAITKAMGDEMEGASLSSAPGSYSAVRAASRAQAQYRAVPSAAQTQVPQFYSAHDIDLGTMTTTRQ